MSLSAITLDVAHVEHLTGWVEREVTSLPEPVLFGYVDLRKRTRVWERKLYFLVVAVEDLQLSPEKGQVV